MEFCSKLNTFKSSWLCKCPFAKVVSIQIQHTQRLPSDKIELLQNILTCTIGGTSLVPTYIGTTKRVKIPRESLMGFNHWHPISVTHVHWHSYLNRILTRDPAWQSNVGGGVFTRDLGTPRLAVENIRLLLYHCNAMPPPEDHFLPLLVADDHLQTERSTIGLFDVWHL